MYHYFTRDNNHYLFDSIETKIIRLPSDVGERFEGVQDKEINELLGNDYLNNKITFKENNYNKCNRLVFIVNQICNLACKYCYADEGSYGEVERAEMDIEVVRKTLKIFIELFPDGIDNIMFFGGEPTLSVELIGESINIIQEIAKENNYNIGQFSIVTNGTLIDENVVDLFNKHNVSVTISMDGNRKINDSYRVYKEADNSVFDKIEKNIKLLNKVRKFPLSVQMTASIQNVRQFREMEEKYLLDIEAIHNLGVDFLHVSPVMCSKDSNESIYNEDAELIESYFDSIAKYSIKSLDTFSPLPVIKTVDFANHIMKKENKKNYCMAGISDFSINYRGEIYPCFVLNNIPKMIMASIFNFSRTEFKKNISKYKDINYEDNEKCKSCWAKGKCSNCIANAYLINGDLSNVMDEACDVNKIMIERVLAEMADYTHGDK